MKRLGLLFLLVIAATAARAGAYNQTCANVSISTYAPTEITNNVPASTSTVPGSVWAVMVMNLDASATLYTSQLVNVSSATGSFPGVPIAPQPAPPYNWWASVINSSKNWYVISSGAAKTLAMVCLTQ